MYKNILSFYRINDWVKSIGFCILGLTATKFLQIINPFLFFIGILQSCFLFSFLFSLNDFFDYIIHKEKNFIGKIIDKSILSKNFVLLLCFLPLLPSITILYLNSSESYLITLLLFIILSISYSLPKIRLRDIPIIDVICNVLFFSLIFLQSYFFVNDIIIPKVYFLLFWIVLYSFSHEILHQISHFEMDKRSGRTSTTILLGKKESIVLFKYSLLLPVLGILFYFLFHGFEVFVGVMILFALMRFFYVLKLNEKSDFKKLRNKLGGILEGGLYLILNILEF